MWMNRLLTVIAVLIGFIVVGVVIYLMMQALAELTVMYPVNGAFNMYIVRFIDPSWGFACGWQYAISWLTVLPFEISAACNVRIALLTGRLS